MSLTLSGKTSLKRKAAELNYEENLDRENSPFFVRFELEQSMFERTYGIKSVSKICPSLETVKKFEQKLQDLKIYCHSKELVYFFNWLLISEFDKQAFFKSADPRGDIFEVLPLVHSFTTKKESEEILEESPEYTFLFRFSETNARSFVVSFIRDGTVHHRRFAIGKCRIVLWGILIDGTIVGRTFSRNKEPITQFIKKICKLAVTNYREEELEKTNFLKPN
jgi:hypothetical protein